MLHALKNVLCFILTANMERWLSPVKIAFGNRLLMLNSEYNCTVLQYLFSFKWKFEAMHEKLAAMNEILLKGLSGEICLAGNGINRQISLKRTGAEIISCFSPSTLKWARVGGQNQLKV